MEQRIFFALLHSGRAADNDDRGFFGESFSGCVGDFETADAISDADSAKTANARVGIGGKTSALFIAGVDGSEFAFGEEVVKAENVIAGDAEDVANAMSVELVDEILADGRRFHSESVIGDV